MRFKSTALRLVGVLALAGVVYASANTLTFSNDATKLGSASQSVNAACGNVLTLVHNLKSDDASKLLNVTFTTTASACDGGEATVTVYDGGTPISGGTATCVVASDSCTTSNFNGGAGVNAADVDSIVITIEGPY